jgi:electron transport complex protein RnfE
MSEGAGAAVGEKTGREVFLRGVWEENPVLVQLLGLCPALAVTNTVENAIAMSLATTFVLTGSSTLVSLAKGAIPDQVRISAFILIIATFVTIVDLIMAALAPSISDALGAFVALIVVNCMILGRQEAFASRHGPGRSILDALGTSAGFTIALLAMGALRELLGAGTLLGVQVMPTGWEPWIIMILPPGGFFTLGVILLGLSWWWERKEERDEAVTLRRWPHGSRTPVESPVGEEIRHG